MSAFEDLPARDRPVAVAVPPARMAFWRSGRPLKRWRYVGLYGEELMLCAARVSIGGLPQSFWAVADGDGMREHTRLAPGRAVVTDDHVRVGPIDIVLEPDGAPMEVTSRHGDSYIWTRKQPVRGRGTIGPAHPRVDLRGLVDVSAGYHARETAWRWCAGVGEAADGTPLAWNLVEGLHDAPHESERTIWVAGATSEPPPGAIADDLSGVTWPGGERLAFAERARRARSDDFRLLASDYVQPFGTFSGALPGGLAVARGWGVMERHTARW
jgi:hypothetical protein